MPGTPLSAPKDIRFRWYRQVEREGRTIKETCRIFGISRKTYHKWYRRDHGYDPKITRPRRLHPQAKLYGHVLVKAIRAKKKYNYGPKKMSLHLKNTLGVSVSANAIIQNVQKERVNTETTEETKVVSPHEGAVCGLICGRERANRR